MQRILEFLETAVILFCAGVAFVVMATFALLISPVGWIAVFFAGLYFLLRS